MRIERNLGADVIMQFDHVIPGQSEEAVARDASERSLRWLARCRAEFERLVREDPIPGRREQALFPIVQGGIHADLRREAARARSATWATGTATASAGCRSARRSRTCTASSRTCTTALPHDRPRYLMGVGFPEDLVEGVRRGVDLFDCVAPTRMGRNGAAFTRDGRLNIKRAEFRTDRRPLDDGVRLRRAARASPAPTSGTSSWPTRSSASASSPCTMYISSCR